MSLDGRIALVTGGGRGIGRGISLALAADGADIAVNYRRGADEANEVVAEIRKMGRKAEAFQGSVDIVEDCANMVAEIGSKMGAKHAFRQCTA